MMFLMVEMLAGEDHCYAFNIPKNGQALLIGRRDCASHGAAERSGAAARTDNAWTAGTTRTAAGRTAHFGAVQCQPRPTSEEISERWGGIDRSDPRTRARQRAQSPPNPGRFV